MVLVTETQDTRDTRGQIDPGFPFEGYLMQGEPDGKGIVHGAKRKKKICGDPPES